MPQNENIVDASQPRRQVKDLNPAQIRYVLRTEYDKLKTNAEKAEFLTKTYQLAHDKGPFGEDERRDGSLPQGILQAHG